MSVVYPVLKPIGESLWVIWSGFTLEFTRIYDHRDAISAEVNIVDEAEGALHWARVNLASTQGRGAITRALEDASPTRPWREFVERSCRLVVLHLRTPAPLEELTPTPPSESRWLIEPVIPTGDITVLFGDGGTGKSLIALAIALHGILAHPLGPWRIAPLHRILYLDWETDAQTHRERLFGLTRTLETPGSGSMLYRRLARPLCDVLTTLKADADRHEIDLVVCDSLAPACGPEPEGADAAVRTLMALRELRGTKLVIAHVSKAQVDQTKGARPFGSVYVQNIARSVLEARRHEAADDDAETVVTLHHRKSNNGRLARSIGLCFAFDQNGTIHVRSSRPDLESANLPTQILGALRSGRQTVSDLSEMLGAKPATVKTNLDRLETKGKVIRLESVTGGKGKETPWGLKLQTDSGL